MKRLCRAMLSMTLCGIIGTVVGIAGFSMVVLLGTVFLGLYNLAPLPTDGLVFIAPWFVLGGRIGLPIGALFGLVQGWRTYGRENPDILVWNEERKPESDNGTTEGYDDRYRA